MKYDLLSKLLPIAESSYRDFHIKLVPELSAENMLGVRMPALRQLGRVLAKGADVNLILQDDSPDRYYEETVIRGIMIGAAKLTLEERLFYIDKYVPRIKNWAVCDSFVSGLRFEKQQLDAVNAFLRPYLASSDEFYARFGVVMLLRFFVREEVIEQTLQSLLSIPAQGYNARMAVAWGLAECLVKYPIPTLKQLEAFDLDVWTHRKTLQKALESKRLPQNLRSVLIERRKLL